MRVSKTHLAGGRGLKDNVEGDGEGQDESPVQEDELEEVPRHVAQHRDIDGQLRCSS